MKRAETLDAVTAAHLAAGGWRLGERVPPGPHAVRTPLAEAGTVGLAAGLALTGQRVVVELVEAAGVARAADALADVASVRSRSGNAWSAPVVVSVPLRVEEDRPAVPRGWVIGVATGDEDAATMLRHALTAADPTMIFLAALPAGSAAVEPAGDLGAGVPLVRREGSVLTVLAEGAGVAVALEAAARLDGEGLSIEVVDLRGAGPDAPLVAARVARTGRVIHVGHGGAEVLLGALMGAFWSLESPPAVLAAREGPEALARLVRATLDA